jgi:heme exporter protein A
VSSFDTVELRGISKTYEKRRALSGVELDLRAGEVMALLGANGAGKSTLLSLLGTLLRPTSGTIRYGNLEGDAVRRHIGVVGHESMCYGDLTGLANVEFFARLYEVKAAKARAQELIGRMGLDAAADRPARTYSRGMLQRLALARALIHRPQLLLLDEPFTGLDRGGVELLGALLLEERARGAILVVTTHDFAAVAPAIDRVVVLRRGKVAHDGPASSDRSPVALEAVYRAASARLSP